jgi:hypothetical protein
VVCSSTMRKKRAMISERLQVQRIHKQPAAGAQLTGSQHLGVLSTTRVAHTLSVFSAVTSFACAAALLQSQLQQPQG